MNRMVLMFLAVLLETGTMSAQSKAPSHEIFSRLLKRNVTTDGKVSYKAFTRDSIELNTYLDLLSATPPDDATWTKNERMAYWINAYNAFTIKLITRYYPIKSIKDIGSSIQLPFINTPWDIKFIWIGNRKVDLNYIEHEVLRKKFKDPRVHMALVCASKSCPILMNEAYTPAILDEQLSKQTRAFLADTFRNNISASSPQLSMIFNWYAMDFKKHNSSVVAFINQYSGIKIKADADIHYIDYNWELNEQ